MKSITVFIGIMLLSVLSFAQVVNVEKRRSEDSTKAVQGFVYVGATLVQNTSDIVQAYDEVQLSYMMNKKNLFLFINEMTFMRIDTTSILNDGYVHFRYNRKFTKKWVVLEAFGQWQYDDALGIENRTLAGIGPRWSLAGGDSLDVFVGTLTMFEQEKRVDTDMTYKNRFAGYVSAHWDITPKSELGFVAYYQPNYVDLNDVRISGETSLKVGFGKHFMFKVSYNARYDEHPLPGIPKYNSSITTKIGVEF